MLKHNMPKHVAIVMDGNGRWAKKRNLPRFEGHRRGVEVLKNIVQASANLKVKILTLFAFSQENWSRPKDEVDSLLVLFRKLVRQESKNLCKNNVKLNFIGDVTRFSSSLQIEIENSVKMTSENDAMLLNVAVNYSGKWDILQSVREIAAKVAKSELEPSAITTGDITANCALSGLPEPDLLIRTGGEQRLSNFLLWQIAYTELYFSNIFWPDFTASDLEKAIDFYQTRERRFGKTSEQLKRNLSITGPLALGMEA